MASYLLAAYLARRCAQLLQLDAAVQMVLLVLGDLQETVAGVLDLLEELLSCSHTFPVEDTYT
jgi:hypothetical protein